ncbi:NADPH-dependent FMN reductase [Salinifilum ghardaiensis]
MSTETAGDGAVRVLGISGSLRSGSYSTAVLRAAAALAEPGVRLSRWRGLGEVPPFNEDDEEHPAEAVRRMRAAIDSADALLIATPEYNTTVPGQLKNAVDWASRPEGEGVLLGKPIAVVGASPSDYGAAWAQAALRKAVASCGAQVVERHLCLARVDEAFGPGEELRDPGQRAQLAEILTELGAEARRALRTSGAA